MRTSDRPSTVGGLRPAPVRQAGRAGQDRETPGMTDPSTPVHRLDRAQAIVAVPRLPREGRIPAPLTTFVGRDAELDQARALLLRPDVRLLTLTGPGGVGKTRLAIETAASLGAGFGDGVVWVSLAEIREPDGVPAAIARSAGVVERRGETVAAALRVALGEGRTLLVLDNLEQVLGAAPLLAELLVACPRLAILATSRARLRISGERVLAVPPLCLPTETARREDGQAARTTDTRAVSPSGRLAVSDSDAVRLFVDRAQAMAPDFAVTGETAGLVAEICHLVDGLPLGIELAAARISHLDLASLAGRLQRRLPILTGGPGDAPSRQHTLRDAIDWSHALLTPPEQDLFRRLAVFQGGFTLDAAEAVGAATPSVLDVLGSLVEKSLVRYEPGGERGPRYAMLETIREYAAELLARSGDAEPGRRHAAYFAALAERAEETFWGGALGTWHGVLGLEQANARAALAWAIGHRETDMALGLAGAVVDPQWGAAATAREQTDGLHRALAMPGGSSAARARALLYAAWTAHFWSDYVAAQAFTEEALSLALSDGDERGIATAMGFLGHVAFHAGDLAAARPLLLDALDRFRGVNPRWAGWTLCQLAATNSRLAIDEGADPADLARAIGWYEEALGLFRAIEEEVGVGRALHGIAYVTYKQRDLPRALARTQELLARDRSRGWPVFHYLEDIADIAGRTGQPLAAARLYGAAARVRTDLDRPIEDVFVDEYARDEAVSRRALGEAAFAAAWDAGRASSPEQAVAEALSLTPAPTPMPERDRDAAPAAPVAVSPAASASPVGLALSPRETEILPHLAAGSSHRSIGEALFISERTVDSHVARLFAKLGVRSRAEALAATAQLGIVGAPAAGPDARRDGPGGV